MTRKNVEIVQAVAEAFARRDHERPFDFYDPNIEWADPDIELVRVDGPAPGSWRGSAAIADGTREMLSAWDEFRLIADEYHELEGDRVLVLDHFTARGKRSGFDAGKLGATGANLFHIAGGKVTRIVTYYHQRAFSDLGLVAETESGSS